MTARQFQLGDWLVEPDTNRIHRGGTSDDLEPKVMDLLVFLSKHPGEVLSKSELAEAVWSGVTVNDDALSRSIWKLRQALGDDARSPRYIETVAKRGYRLIGQVSDAPITSTALPPSSASLQKRAVIAAGATAVLFAVLLFALPLLRSDDDAAPPALSASQPLDRAALLERADGFYHQFTREQNEAALQLYEALLQSDPGDAAAMAGLANALTQRVVRWTSDGDTPVERQSLSEALESGWLDQPQAVTALSRAEGFAREASMLDPSHARAWRALGLILSAQRDFEGAASAYNRALVIDPDNWGAMINMSEIVRLTDQPEQSAAYLEQAFDAMSRRYSDEAVLIRPWQSQVGVSIAREKIAAGAIGEAELWYRRVLALDPLQVEAVSGLAAILSQSGDPSGAEALCAELQRLAGTPCQTVTLEPSR